MRVCYTSCRRKPYGIMGGMEQVIKSVVTLETFAKKTGCHFTTASRLRSGHRLPSGRLLARIVKEFDLRADEAMQAYTSGESEFGEYLREKVFAPIYESQETLNVA
jgi:transcriptional regulator with XRE-family HTH domain